MSTISVALDQKLAREYAIFARRAGMSVEFLVNDILDDWMEVSRRFDNSVKQQRKQTAATRKPNEALGPIQGSLKAKTKTST